jgi:fermentation-respiration switch protein FrsA (DUF1100 family)
LKHPFDSLSRAASVERPVLVLAGTADRLITPDRSRRLHDAWAGRPRSLVLLEGADHASVHAHPQYRPRIEAFLRGVVGH